MAIRTRSIYMMTANNELEKASTNLESQEVAIYRQLSSRRATTRLACFYTPSAVFSAPPTRHPPPTD